MVEVLLTRINYLICSIELKLDNVQCSNCLQRTCINCIKLIYNKISPIRHDDWCFSMKQYINSGRLSPKFIGHCCELKQRLKNNISSRTIRKSKKLLCDGYLFIPECNLILDSPIETCVDVHGFGKGDTEINALMHGVIGQELARQLWQKGTG